MRALLCGALLACGPLLALGACGGTSSETPWPVEPDEQQVGPSGETSAPEPKPAEVAEEADAGPPPRAKKAAQPER